MLDTRDIASLAADPGTACGDVPQCRKWQDVTLCETLRVVLAGV